MKNKFKKIFTITSLSIIGLGSIATIAPIVTSCSSNTDKNQNQNNPNNNQTNNQDFVDNTNQIRNNLVLPSISVYQPPQNLHQKWDQFRDDPNLPVYKQLFDRINANVLTTDIKSVLCNDVKTNNPFADLNIENFNVSKTNNNYNASIKFKVKNNNIIKRDFKLSFLKDNNSGYKLTMQPNEISDFEIKLENSTNTNFFTKKLTLNSNYETLYANYKLSNVKLFKNNQLINTYQDVAFDPLYSKALATIITNVNNELTQTSESVKQAGINYLNSLTISNIQDDIQNKILNIVNLVKQIVGPVQTLLQSLTKNESLEMFIKNNSAVISELIVSFINIPNINAKDFTPIIQSVLNDESLPNIINNNKQLINDKIVPLIPEGAKEIATGVINMLSTDAGIDQLHKMLQQEPFISILGQTFIDNVPKLKTEGLIKFICDNFDNVIAIVKNFIPSIYESLKPLLPLIRIIVNNYANSQSGVIDDIIALIKTTDPATNQSYLKTILSGIIKNPAILKILDIAVFNNPNINATNLIKLINIIATPYGDEQTTIPMNYSDWLNSVQITPTFNSTNSYDATTHKANIKFSLQFKFTKTIYFKIGDLFSIIPNINLGVTSSSAIIKKLPQTFGIFSGDYITFNMDNTNVTLNYDVKQKNKTNYIIWNMASNNYIDINMPASLNHLAISSQELRVLLFKIDFPKIFSNLLKNIFYGFFNDKSVFEGNINLTNPIIKEPYNYNSYNEEAVLLNNNISLTEKELLKQEIIKSITENNVANSAFTITKPGAAKPIATINKSYTTTSYQTPASTNPLSCNKQNLFTTLAATDPINITINNEYEFDPNTNLQITPTVNFNNLSPQEQSKVQYQWKYKNFLGSLKPIQSSLINKNLDYKFDSTWNNTQICLVASYNNKEYKSNFATLKLKATTIPAITITNINKQYSITEQQTLTINPTIKNQATDASYQWQKSTDNGTSWTDIANQTSATLTISNIDKATWNNVQVKLVVKDKNNPNGVSSNPTTIKVISSTPSITIELQKSYTVEEKKELSITTNPVIEAITNTKDISYQWQKSIDNGTSWTDIANQTTTTLTISNIDKTYNNAQIKLVATYNNQKFESNTTTITVTPEVMKPVTTIKSTDVNMISILNSKTPQEIIDLYKSNPKDPIFTKIIDALKLNFNNLPLDATIEITNIGVANKNKLTNVQILVKKAQLPNNQIGDLAQTINIIVSAPKIEDLFDLSNYTGKYSFAIEVNHLLCTTPIVAGFSAPDVYLIKVKLFTQYNVYGPTSEQTNKPVNMIEITL